MKIATVGHLLRKDGQGKLEILLGKRNGKRNFKNGSWDGPGGERERPECILRCLERELEEEVGIQIAMSSVRHYATIDYYHPDLVGHSLEWRVYFFTITKWEGEPVPIEGFSELAWYSRNDPPYDIMMSDLRVWLSAALNNPRRDKIYTADIYYGDPKLKNVTKGSFKFVRRHSFRST